MVLLQGLVFVFLSQLTTSSSSSSSASSSAAGVTGKFPVRAELIHSHAAAELEISTIERYHVAANTSRSRVQYLSSSSSVAVTSSDLKAYITSAHEGTYRMKLKLGTPVQELESIVDTGSDLLWVECTPCSNCVHDRKHNFNPRNSSSYKSISCHHPQCKSFSDDTGPPKCNTTCKYRYVYGDDSGSYGNIAHERITLSNLQGEEKQLQQKVMFGCGRRLLGNWGDSTKGLLGLGRGNISLLTQLSEKKFSYCLVSFANATKKKSALFFGDTSSLLHGSNIKTTPMLTGKGLHSSMYLVDLQAVSIDGEHVKLSNGLPLHRMLSERTVIDSGTAFGLFTLPVYNAIKSMFINKITLPIVDGSQYKLDLCYDRSHDMKYKFPSLVLHLKNAEIVLPLNNYFGVVDIDVDGVMVCLLMDESGNELSVIGNMFQQNFHVSYDLEKRHISFQPAQCDAL